MVYRRLVTFGAFVFALIMVVSVFAVVVAQRASAAPAGPVGTGSTPSSSAASPSASTSSAAPRGFGINTALATAVKEKEQAILAAGGNLSNFHPPNLHEGLPPSQTHGVVTPLYNAAPAPIGVAYFGLNNTTGTIQATSVNTTSLVGTWNTTDPSGTAADLIDTAPGGNVAGMFGAQLNSVLVNVTLKGQTNFATDNNAPTGCPAAGDYLALPGNVCPNEFWLQNYIQYTESTHTFTISGEIWNFSNPTADWSGSGTQTIEGFGSVESAEVYQSPSSGTINAGGPDFTVALYENYSQGPCHTDSVAGTGVPSCGTISQTEPVNELFLNYTVWNEQGQKVCPTSIRAGTVCGEFDQVFFNSVGPSNAATGVPNLGPHGETGSAYIQANGTNYDPLGLTNDFEFDYAIGSSDGATNPIVYTDGSVGVDYCQNPHAVQSAGGGIKCSAYSTPPAAVDFGGETGETSTGESVYWAPQGPPGFAPGETLVPGGASVPVAHMTTGPSILVGLWNMTGSTVPGNYQNGTYGFPGNPLPAYTGGTPFSYASIAPANAWVGIAQENQNPTAGTNQLVTSQEYFQVAPTFGYFSYWAGSGGSPHVTELGSNLYLPSGWYTIEVLLSGYTPVVEQVDVTGVSPVAPSIALTPDASTGAYTLDWAFSNSDLANLSASPPTYPNPCSNPCVISAGAPDVGTVDGVVIGEPGSVSWLFSNVNDYFFTQWIGAFINSTTAVTQFNPAPSFPMEYPSWQLSALAQFNLPTTDGFQYYLMNVQNLAVLGATDIYAWGNSEATTIYSFVVNNGANDLIGGNTFQVSNRGIEFINGGTTSTFTINGAPVAPVLTNTRNVVWGNTFNPHPQTTFTGLEPFTSADSLTLGETFDRVYNNAFMANATARDNATANAGATDTAWWNVTCVSGYGPLKQETYPGSGPTGVCESTSYSQSLDGYAMSGAINGASYQGGNFWSVYGNEPNPYGNLPVKIRLTSLTGTAQIASAAVAGTLGDYAPLITNSVSELTFKETGLPSSATTTEFTMRLTNSTGYGWLNTSATNVNPASCGGGTYVCVNFYVPFGTYGYAATPPASYAANPAVGSGYVFNTASQLVTISFGTAEAVTFTETGLPGGTRWYVNITGQSPLTSTTSTITINLPSGSYAFTAASSNKSYAPSYTPSFTVSGAPTGVPVTFSLFTYTATFSESGLPGGSWNVTANAVDEAASVPNSIVFNLPNGTYSFTVGTFNGFSANPGTGSITVAGAPASQAITFSRVTYTVSFTESGLPAVDTWYVNVTGGPSLSGTGAQTTLMTTLANGTYGFTVATNDKTYAPSYTDHFIVSGSPVTVSITFSLVTYTLTFKETGLPSGTSWSATINAVMHTSTGSTITFSETNGTYSYSAVVPAYGGAASGSAVVNGAPTMVTLAYHKVNFTESGLPTSTSWSVTTNGATLSSITTSIVFYEVNGAYTYTIGVISGYHAVDSGAYTVSSSAVTIHTAFSKTTYVVKFSESGLTKGWDTRWCVTVNGVSKCETNIAALTFSGLANGTYSYNISHVTNYSLAASYTGSVVVSGSGQGMTTNSMTVPFKLVKYAVTFTESGLPSHTSWQVTFAGVTQVKTTKTIVFDVSNGTYSFSASASGYDAAPSSGSLTVNGAPVGQTIVFTLSEAPAVAMAPSVVRE